MADNGMLIAKRHEAQICVENVDFLVSWRLDPIRIAKRLGSTTEALSKRLYRAGRPDLANYMSVEPEPDE